MALLGFEKRWLMLVADTIFPSRASDRLPVGARDLPMERFFDDVLARAPARMRLGVRAMLWLLAVAPLFFLGKLRTFAGLAANDRIRLLERMQQSRVYVIREIPMLFKALTCMGYCGHPEVQRRVGITQADPTPPAWASEEAASP